MRAASVMGVRGEGRAGRRPALVAAAVLSGLAACVPTSHPTAVGCDGCQVLLNAKVFDGHTALGVRAVVLEGGRISAVVEGPVTVTAGASVDLGGRTLLPGLIDLHTHLQGSGAPDGFVATRPPQGSNLKQMLRAGVTSFLDLGDDAHVSFAWRQHLRDGDLLGPRMFSAGPFLEPNAGGHCAGGTASHDHCLILESAADVAALLPGLLAARPDALKMTLESGSPTAPLIPLKPEVVRALVAAAADAGVPLISHVNDNVDFAAALDAQVPALTHMPLFEPLAPALAQQIADRQLPVAPTLAALDGLNRLAHHDWPELTAPGIGQNLPADVLAGLADPALLAPLVSDAAGLQARFDTYQANFRALRALGATFVFGSDSGYHGAPFGLSAHRELKLMVQGGMTPTEALTAATSRAADFLRRGDLGRIEPGATADLLAVRGDLLAGIDAIDQVDAVYLGGKPLDLAALALDGTTTLVQAPVTGLAAGAACLGSAECAAGLTCDAMLWCGAVCALPGDCPTGSSCLPTLGGSGCVQGEGCSPLAQDCPNGANCAALGNGATLCFDVGVGTNGASCAGVKDCARGYLCVQPGVCRPLCDPAAPVCPAGLTCLDGTVQAGVPFGRCG